MTLLDQPYGMPSHLSREDLEEIGKELDIIREDVMLSRNEKDRAYILRLIKVQRYMVIFGRLALFVALLSLAASFSLGFYALLAGGIVTLGLAKILDNMEIGHNVMHGQWDWMHDPSIHSSKFEWDNSAPSDNWIHQHNVVHHTWTNVIGKDDDIGYNIMRLNKDQKWHWGYLFQPFYSALLILFFEFGVAIQDNFIDDLVSKKPWAQVWPRIRHILAKITRQLVRDYVLWPAVMLALLSPFLLSSSINLSAWSVFMIVVMANFIANLMRNIWSAVIIFCGHFPSNVYLFSEKDVENEEKGHWYVRQMLGSCNISGSKLLHLMSGNLSHQIEHHLFPDMCSNRYAEVAPKVKALAQKYNIQYNSDHIFNQFGTVLLKIFRFSLP